MLIFPWKPHNKNLTDPFLYWFHFFFFFASQTPVLPSTNSPFFPLLISPCLWQYYLRNSRTLLSLSSLLTPRLGVQSLTLDKSLLWILPGEWQGNPLQYLAWRIPMDKGAWQATVLGVAENWTRLKNLPLITWISSVQSLSHVWLFTTPWTVACQGC